MAFDRPSKLHSHCVVGACLTTSARLDVFQPLSFHDTLDFDLDFLLLDPPSNLSPTVQNTASSPLLQELPLRQSNQKLQCANAAFMDEAKAWLTENSIGNLDHIVSNDLGREQLDSFASSTTRCSYGPQPSRKRNTGRRAADKAASLNTQKRLNHKESERRRRKEMNCQFTTIQALLPRPANDRCTTITESINYIQSLQRQVEELGRKRRKLLECMQAPQIGAPKCASDAPSVMETLSTTSAGRGPSAAQPEPGCKFVCEANMHVYEKEVFISVTSSKMGNILSGLMGVLNELDLELLNANMSMSDSLVFFSIHATAKENQKQCKEYLRHALEVLIGINVKVENVSL